MNDSIYLVTLLAPFAERRFTAMKINHFINGVKKAPTTQKKSDKTVEDAMTDGFVERIKLLAKEDAQKGIYMDKGYLQLQHPYLEQI